MFRPLLRLKNKVRSADVRKHPKSILSNNTFPRAVVISKSQTHLSSLKGQAWTVMSIALEHPTEMAQPPCSKCHMHGHSYSSSCQIWCSPDHWKDHTRTDILERCHCLKMLRRLRCSLLLDSHAKSYHTTILLLAKTDILVHIKYSDHAASSLHHFRHRNFSQRNLRAQSCSVCFCDLERRRCLLMSVPETSWPARIMALLNISLFFPGIDIHC
jgi:hypothetical protein